MKGFTKHIVILVALICISAILYLTDSQNLTSSIDQNLFLVKDTSQIQSIKIERSSGAIDVKRKENQWVVNETYSADLAVISIMNVIMSKVQVIRPVSQLNVVEIKKDLLDKGQKITISLSDQILTFYTGGNTNKTQSYFADETLEHIYLVGIPGYNNYLTGIFELTINQWRARVLFASSWRSIQSLTIDYQTDKEDLDIYFEKRNLLVRNIDPLDSTLLIDYLKIFEGFQLNDYLESGKFPSYDSLMNTKPLAIITLKDIDERKDQELTVFDIIKGQQFYLITNPAKDMIVIDEKRAKLLFKSNSEFALKANIRVE